MKILPCDKCARSSQELLNDELIKAIETRDDLIKWGHNFHNDVNSKLQIKHLKFETFMDYMTALKSGNKHKNFLTFENIVIFILILVLLYLLIKHYT
jgi:hypothetical protein